MSRKFWLYNRYVGKILNNFDLIFPPFFQPNFLEFITEYKFIESVTDSVPVEQPHKTQLWVANANNNIR